MITEAIILAGGLGTRLRPAVPDLPKCMAPVAGKPFLHFVLQYFQKQGISKFVLALGYKHQLIERFIRDDFAKQGSAIQFSIEKEPLGTGGAVNLACRQIEGMSFLLVNGDTFFGINVKALSEFHQSQRADCCLSLKPMARADRYGIVLLNQDDSIRRFEEKKAHSSGLINGGVYTLQTESFVKENLPEKFSFEKEYLEKLYSLRRMFGFRQDKYFIDIGLPEDYERAQIELPQNM